MVIANIQMAVNIPPRGGTPLYKLYRYVPPHPVVVHRFGLKTGLNFAHFGSGLGYVFRGNFGSHDILIVSISNEKYATSTTTTTTTSFI